MSALIGTVLSELIIIDHAGAARRFHHVVGDDVQAVDPQDAIDLAERAVEKTEIAARIRAMVATACASVTSASSIASPRSHYAGSVR